MKKISLVSKLQSTHDQIFTVHKCISSDPFDAFQPSSSLIMSLGERLVIARNTEVQRVLHHLDSRQSTLTDGEAPKMTSSTFIAHPFAPIFLQRSPSTARSTLRRSRYACAATRRPSICCSDARVPDGTPEPVKDGVDLPEVGKEALETHTSWLEIEVRTWLDSEWRDKDAWKAHHQISVRTAQIYRRLRIEGMNDLTSILLGLGGDLEDADFSKTYTGPWDVANKAAELLIERFLAGGLGDQRDAPQPEASKEQWSVLTEMNRQPELDDSYIASAPSLSDEFERYRFLQMVLDGSATKAVRTFLSFSLTLPICEKSAITSLAY